MKINHEVIAEWTATALVIFGALALTLDYYLLSKMLYLFGAIGWLIVGHMWKKNSIVLVNLFIIGIFMFNA